MNCPSCNTSDHEPDAKFCHVCGTALARGDIGDVVLYRIDRNGVYGFADQHGQVVVEPRFTDAHDFSFGMAAVQLDGLWGYIDRKGGLVIKPRFERAGDFYEGRAAVYYNSFWGYIDMEGRLVIPCQYHMAGDFSEGRAPVCKDYRWGFIDNSGRRRIPLQYEEAHSFRNGLARVRVNGRFGFIDRRGRHVVEPVFVRARDYSDGYALVQQNDHSYDAFYSYIDRKGHLRLYCRWNCADDFHEGLACVGTGGGFGYIDRRGKEVVPPLYDDASVFSEGIAAIKLGNLWGYIGKDGKTVIDPRYSEAGPFRNGLAIVRDGDAYRVIDKGGTKRPVRVHSQPPANTREFLYVPYVNTGIKHYNRKRCTRSKLVHHISLVLFGILVSVIEFYVFTQYGKGWWAFVPFFATASYTSFQISSIEEIYEDDFRNYEYALSFVPLVIMNAASFFFMNAWSLAVMYPALVIFARIVAYVHGER